MNAEHEKNVADHVVSFRNGPQVMVSGMSPSLSDLGYRRGSQVVVADASAASLNSPWEFVVENDEIATLVSTRPPPPDWITPGVRVRVTVLQARGTSGTGTPGQRAVSAPVRDGMHRITVDAEVCHGKPSVRGLRYPVEMVLELLSAGMTFDEVLTDYPDLEREDLLAVLAYAARLSRSKRLEPAGA